MLGELLLPPVRLRQLTWDELDCLLAGADNRRQKEMAGFRLVAVQVHNAHFEKPLAERDYLYLPAVDGPAPIHKPDTAWLERMKARYGDKLEA